ncbi:MAG: aldehyde dehydrogenase family protein [Planctomycetes bacterium]|nr:aldehyde dehydrogenase family protein [Planctomycetota bacterium]
MTTLAATPIPERIAALRSTFLSGRTKDLAWRRRQLERLIALMRENEERIFEALTLDMGKPREEAYGAEIGTVVGETEYTLKRLHKWAKPEKVRTNLINLPGSSMIQREPLGVVLVIAPWNYPIQLALLPVMGALAAGNCVVLKPSEITTHSAALMAELLPNYLDPQAVTVVEGGVAETTELLEQRFDHVFFTGSTRVGQIVMQAAAKHLTPVTLELGGKSPTLVDEDVDLEVAARRIAWGKFFNCGQTCLAPDYVLVHGRREQELVDALKAAVESFYGEDPQTSKDFARIVSAQHHQRLVSLIEGQTVVCGGVHDAATRYLAPTILRDVDPGSPIMQEEIFGPILPVLRVESMDEAIEFVRARPRPLGLYVFSRNKAVIERALNGISAGGVSVNDTMAHFTVPELPFGGVGQSGMGAYHGKHSFETFSHRKAVIKKATFVDPALRYPPYSGLKWLRRLIG